VNGLDEATVSQGGTCPEPTCLDTTCGIYITYYGYTCDTMIGYGYDCSLCDQCDSTPMSSGDDGELDISHSIVDNYPEIRETMSSLDKDSKEWLVMNKMIGRIVPEFNYDDNSHDRDSIEKISYKLASGYSLVSDYHVKVAKNGNPNGQTYRAAQGFNVYKQTDDGGWVALGTADESTTYQVTTDPVGCYAVSAYDNSPSYESGLSNTVCLDNVACPVIGDLNFDLMINVSDIVYLVNSILGSGLDASCGDMNGDGSINVSDVVALVNVILNPRSADANDATESVILITENSLKLESNGFVQGVQLTLSHDSGFEIELSDAYVSEYKTLDNQTTLMIVTDGSHSINDIATFSGDMIIESIHVVNQSGDVTVEETVELANFEVKVTGPNPFNPSTQLNIVVPEAGFVSVNVYNILGQKVATLVDGYMDASSAGHMVNFNASHLASGVYLVRAVTANDVATQKLMLLK
jgi:hypothetical protein